MSLVDEPYRTEIVFTSDAPPADYLKGLLSRKFMIYVRTFGRDTYVPTDSPSEMQEIVKGNIGTPMTIFANGKFYFETSAKTA